MKPQDVSDLYLAPVALAVDARLEEHGALTPDGLAERVALASDEADWTVELRRDGVIRTVGHLLDLHDWELSWETRGVGISHASHRLVLGIPDSLRVFVNRT